MTYSIFRSATFWSIWYFSKIGLNKNNKHMLNKLYRKKKFS